MTNNAQNEKRAKERVENLRRLLAQSITRLDGANDLFRYECKEFGWDEDLAYCISKTIGRLGVHLASISQWFDEDEENEDSNK